MEWYPSALHNPVQAIARWTPDRKKGVHAYDSLRLAAAARLAHRPFPTDNLVPLGQLFVDFFLPSIGLVCVSSTSLLSRLSALHSIVRTPLALQWPGFALLSISLELLVLRRLFLGCIALKRGCTAFLDCSTPLSGLGFPLASPHDHLSIFNGKLHNQPLLAILDVFAAELLVALRVLLDLIADGMAIEPAQGHQCGPMSPLSSLTLLPPEPSNTTLACLTRPLPARLRAASASTIASPPRASSSFETEVKRAVVLQQSLPLLEAGLAHSLLGRRKLFKQLRFRGDGALRQQVKSALVFSAFSTVRFAFLYTCKTRPSSVNFPVGSASSSCKIDFAAGCVLPSLPFSASAGMGRFGASQRSGKLRTNNVLDLSSVRFASSNSLSPSSSETSSFSSPLASTSTTPSSSDSAETFESSSDTSSKSSGSSRSPSDPSSISSPSDFTSGSVSTWLPIDSQSPAINLLTVDAFNGLFGVLSASHEHKAESSHDSERASPIGASPLYSTASYVRLTWEVAVFLVRA
ncbi:hypothetical protein KC357_g173 [Hortaea werneckii]|nr:hypothetical protein KC357_g173 [Hortaea werneckii]